MYNIKTTKIMANNLFQNSEKLYTYNFTPYELILVRDAISNLIDEVCAGDASDYEPDLDTLMDIMDKLSAPAKE